MLLLSKISLKVKGAAFFSLAVILSSCAPSQVSTQKAPVTKVGERLLEKEVTTPEARSETLESKAKEGFGDWNPSEETKDCRQDQRIIFDSKLLVDCLSTLDEVQGRIFLRNAFWADTLWVKSLESRRAAYLHLQKNRRQEEARDLLDQLLNVHAVIDPYQQETLRWLDSEALGQEERKGLWKAKFHEIENALRIGNSKVQIEKRLKDFDRDLLDPKELAHLDSVLAKAETIDRGKLLKKWAQYQKEENPAQKADLKQVLVEKYAYLFNKEQRLALASPEDREINTEKECEAKRTKAAEYLIQSKKQIKRKRELLKKASGELKSCLDSLPEGDYKEKIAKEYRRIKRRQ